MSSWASDDVLDELDFTVEELEEIDRYAAESGTNLWPPSSDA